MSLVTGAISWFGGPNDKTTGATTASGAPITQPGIAVYNQSTLGGYWLLGLPGGKSAIVKQTDIGPAPSTGRKFDFSYSLLPLLGYSQKNFPTGASAKGVYLGKTIQQVFTNFNAAAGQVGVVSDQVPADPSFFNQLKTHGYQGLNFDMLTPTGGGAAYNNAVQSAGQAAQNATTGIAGTLAGIWNSIVQDAKYAAVLVAVLALGVFLIVHGLSGVASGGERQRSFVPVPV